MSLKITDEYRTMKAVIVRNFRCPRCFKRVRRQQTFTCQYGNYVYKPPAWRRGDRWSSENRGMTRAEATQYVDSVAAAWVPDNTLMAHDHCRY